MHQFLSTVRAFLKTFWNVIVAGLTIVGILTFWPTIRDLPHSYGLEWEFPAWLGRENLSYAFNGLLLLWIAWSDARPFIRRWLEKHHSAPFLISERIYCQSHPIKDAENIYRSSFYLCAGNNLKTGETLRRVQARLFHFGPPLLCRVRDSEKGETDIRDGEWAFFEIGHLASKEILGNIGSSIKIDQNVLEVYKDNIPQGYLCFEIGAYSRDRELGLSHALGYLPQNPNIWSVSVILSADSVKSQRVEVKIDMGNHRSPVVIEPG